MLQKTRAIVLRSVKYGESSIVATLFTEVSGIQTYMVKGVRNTKVRLNRSGYFQPGMLLDLVVYQQPQKNMQHIREFSPAYIYGSIQESVVKNSIVLFSAELLLRLLPEHAALPELFSFAFNYFITLDQLPTVQTANLPVFFIVQCSRDLGYELNGSYSSQTPYLNLQEGGFTSGAPTALPYTTDEDALVLNMFLREDDYELVKNLEMNAAMRFRLIDWFVAFLHEHTKHMGNMKSLPILREILH